METFNSTSVLISYENEYSTSGIMISNNWVITTGIILKSKIKADKNIVNQILSRKSGKLISLNELLDELTVEIQYNDGKNQKKFGLILTGWICESLKKTLDDIFLLWKPGNDSDDEFTKILLSIFVIISINNLNVDKFVDELSHMINNRTISDDELVKRGATVEITSTPFGNSIFFNSVSKGVISNILGKNRSVILTDANVFPGSEGGLVEIILKNGRKQICGMVISCWANYTLAACLFSCLKSFSINYSVRIGLFPEIKQNENDYAAALLDLLDKCVVLIKCGMEWGSGIILDRDTGTIITCSHVIAPHQPIKVIYNQSSESTRGKLIYQTPKGLPYDIAVINVVPPVKIQSIHPIKMATDPVKGEMVFSAGFPFFLNLPATVSVGNLSRVDPCMIQTTCSIQSGASGGPILRLNGDLLGMVVCNVIKSSVIYPRLNMAVPSSVFKKPIQQYIKTRDVTALDALANYDKDVLRMWNFQLASKI